MITIDDLSTPLHEFDFNMLIILFKNENDSILKLISFNDTSKLTIDPMDINKLIVPNLERFVSMAPVRSKTIDRFTQQSLLHEPVFNEYGDARRGQSD